MLRYIGCAVEREPGSSPPRDRAVFLRFGHRRSTTNPATPAATKPPNGHRAPPGELLFLPRHSQPLAAPVIAVPAMAEPLAAVELAVVAVDAVKLKRARSRAPGARRSPASSRACLPVLRIADSAEARFRRRPRCSPTTIPATPARATTTIQRGAKRAFERAAPRSFWPSVARFRRLPWPSAAFGGRRRLAAGHRRRGRHVGLPGSLTSGPRGPS